MLWSSFFQLHLCLSNPEKHNPLLIAHRQDMEIWMEVFARKFKTLVTTIASGREERRMGNWCYWGTVSNGRGDTPLEMDCARWSRQSFGIHQCPYCYRTADVKWWLVYSYHLSRIVIIKNVYEFKKKTNFIMEAWTKDVGQGDERQSMKFLPLSFFSCVETPRPKPPREDRGFFSHLQMRGHPEGKSNQEPAGSWSRGCREPLPTSFLFVACSAYSLKYPRTTWPGMTQSFLKTMTHRLSCRPTWWRWSLNGESLHSWCQLDKKKKKQTQPAHHPSLKTWIQSPSNQMKSKQSQVCVVIPALGGSKKWSLELTGSLPCPTGLSC